MTSPGATTVLVNGFGAYHGGIVRVHNAICRELAAAGYLVSVANAPRAQDTIAGVSVLSRQTSSRRRSFLGDARKSLRLRRFDLRIDSAPAFRLLTPAGRRCVVVHDLNFLDPATHRISRGQLWYRRLLNAWSFWRADIVVVNSLATRDEAVAYRRSVGPKLRVQPLPADLPAGRRVWSPRPTDGDALRLLTFGHARNKGVEHLLRLMAARDGVALRVIAREEQWAELWAPLAAELGVIDRVSVVQDMSDEDLVEEYLACDVFFMLSSYEGYGLPVVEALSLGVPTVVSSLEVLSQTARGFATVAADLTVEGLESAIKEVRATDASHWSAAARELGANSWREWCEELMRSLDG